MNCLYSGICSCLHGVAAIPEVETCCCDARRGNVVLLHCHVVWHVTDSLCFYILPSESPNGILFIKQYFQIKINNLQRVCVIQEVTSLNTRTLRSVNVWHLHRNIGIHVVSSIVEPRRFLNLLVMPHAMRVCYCFGYDVTVRFIETRMFQTSGLNRK